MSTNPSVGCDERTVAVENAGYRWAYTFVSFALLIDVGYRAMFRHEAAWDLMALLIVGGAVCFVHQVRQKTLGPGWRRQAVLIACLGAVIGLIVVGILLAFSKIVP